MAAEQEHPVDSTAAVRAFWDALAPRRTGEPADFFAAGGTTLSPAELAAAGDVAGQRILQLACSTGDEAISFALLGGQVSAVDAAAAHLDTARAKAAQLDLAMDFRCADMTQLPVELTGIDLIHLSWGVLCWVADLTGFMTQLAGRLAPGGRILIAEHHPLWEVLTVTGDNQLKVSADHFGAGRRGFPDPAKGPQALAVGEDPEPAWARQVVSQVWGLGAVVSAVLAAGLRIETLDEQPEPEMWPGLGEPASWLPVTYLLVVSRPDGPASADRRSGE